MRDPTKPNPHLSKGPTVTVESLPDGWVRITCAACGTVTTLLGRKVAIDDWAALHFSRSPRCLERR